MFYKTIIFLAFGLTNSEASPLDSSLLVAHPFARLRQNINNESTYNINGFESNQSQLLNSDTLDATEANIGVEIASEMKFNQVDINSIKDSVDQLFSAFSTEISGLKEKIGKLSLIDHVK